MRSRITHASSAPWLRACCAAIVLGLLLTPGLAVAATCVVPDAGGTAVIPPPSPSTCGYISPTDLHVIIAGLPPGTTIQVGVQHERFFPVNTMTPGGNLGGSKENFNSQLTLTMTGTGSLSGYNRTVPMMNVPCETHTAPRTPGMTPQSFDTDMFALQGQLPAGDPDFDLLRITAGTSLGMPSPGHTTLTRMGPPGSPWSIDSFFDITYKIEFIGKPGGPLGGMSGSTTGTIRMGMGEPVGDPVPTDPPPCTVVDNGTGTAYLPPEGCDYVSPQDLHMMIDGLPPGTTIIVAAEHNRFFNVHHNPTPDGGENEQFQSELKLRLKGTGGLDIDRAVTVTAQCLAHSGPRGGGGGTPPPNIQSFDTEMLGIQGQLPAGDPDFDLLRITAGGPGGFPPSPGHTTLTRNPTTGRWNVDSFFDITYRIEFTGTTTNPSSPLFGRGGSTTGTIRMATGGPTTLDVPPGGDSHVGAQLLGSAPNPFGTGTTVQYRMKYSGEVRIRIFDAAGHVVRNLLNDLVPAGPHAMYWDGRNDAGRKLPSGTYFVQMTVDGKTVGTRKTIAIN